MSASDSPILRQSVRWGEEYVSRGLNAKFAGIIKPGVYRGFRLKPGGGMSVLVDHEPDYPRSVAVVERDGYSLTVVMDDPGTVLIPAPGTWFICIEAFYAPTQQGYQRIVVRDQTEPHHVVLGKVYADGADGSDLVISEEMISSEGRNEASADVASVKAVEAIIAQVEACSNALSGAQAKTIATLIRVSDRLTRYELAHIGPDKTAVLMNTQAETLANLIRLSDRFTRHNLASLSSQIVASVPGDGSGQLSPAGYPTVGGVTVAPVSIVPDGGITPAGAALSLHIESVTE